jgi:hypothetical protein
MISRSLSIKPAYNEHRLAQYDLDPVQWHPDASPIGKGKSNFFPTHHIDFILPGRKFGNSQASVKIPDASLGTGSAKGRTRSQKKSQILGVVALLLQTGGGRKKLGKIYKKRYSGSSFVGRKERPPFLNAKPE